MSFRRMLEGRNFDPKSAATLVEALNEIVDELYLRSPAERERAARIVIELAAGKTTLDVARLRDEAVRKMRRESADLHDSDLDQLGGLQGDLRAPAVETRAGLGPRSSRERP